MDKLDSTPDKLEVEAAAAAAGPAAVTAPGTAMREVSQGGTTHACTAGAVMLAEVDGAAVEGGVLPRDAMQWRPPGSLDGTARGVVTASVADRLPAADAAAGSSTADNAAGMWAAGMLTMAAAAVSAAAETAEEEGEGKEEEAKGEVEVTLSVINAPLQSGPHMVALRTQKARPAGTHHDGL